MGYIRDHWSGQHSLGWSFLVNLVLLRLVIFYLDRFTAPPYVEDPSAILAATVGLFVVGHLIVFPWQLVGVLRACDRHLSELGSIAWVWAVYLGLAVSVVFILIGAFGAVQRLAVEPQDAAVAERAERERASKYALTLAKGNTRLRLEGTIELGLTKKLEALLRQHAGIEGLVLESIGGNIYEARGIARLAREFGLNTYVFGFCYSACTTAFIGGSTRVLGADGRLGFHRYGLEADYPIPLADPEGEQDKDRRFYERQGIGGAFLARVFNASQSDLWYPSNEELLQAGVVHRIEGSPR